MRRIQFYPNEALGKLLDEEACAMGTGIGTLVVDLLNEHYGLLAKDKYSESQLTRMVLDELKAYVANPNSKEEFDILNASETFAGIEMTFAGKPSTIRAKIGKKFAAQVGAPGPFKNVEIAYRPNGKIKKSANNATIYRITK